MYVEPPLIDERMRLDYPTSWESLPTTEQQSHRPRELFVFRVSQSNELEPLGYSTRLLEVIALLLKQQLGRRLGVVEEGVDLIDVVLCARRARGGYAMKGVRVPS